MKRNAAAADTVMRRTARPFHPFESAGSDLQLCDQAALVCEALVTLLPEQAAWFGTQVTKEFEGQVLQRFTGHIARVSGAQWLHNLGVPLQCCPKSRPLHWRVNLTMGWGLRRAAAAGTDQGAQAEGP
ncbi:hypothetical protein AK812_SmicGene31602 [Symbiodinium microadriaticum]|uniref:Uncharacterized protein n=1 Tax=Symbiodinium microadriaticum TaxID=2951 RepID=A0A1Q9CWE5_SYMMI|nr:hypothetical protein AK812_SmicGene31602 [Symbiodinium microadriaticum]